MIKISSLVTGLLFSFAAFSQPVLKHTLKAGAGLTLAIPVYNLDISSTGGGIDAFVQYGVCGNTAVTADAGFIGLPGRGRFPSTAIIPVRLGLKYFPASKLYFSGKAGLGIYTILKASANHFAYSLGSGYLITKKIDAALSFDGYTNKNSSFGYLAIRAGYRF